MIWAVIIGVIVLLIAIALQMWVMTVFENEKHFFYIVGGFIVLFVGATTACFWLLPDLQAGSNVRAVVDAWINPGTAAKADADNLPLLK